MIVCLALVSSVSAEGVSPVSPLAVDPSKDVPEHIQRSAPEGHALTGDTDGPGSEVEELKETEIFPPDQAASQQDRQSGHDQQNVRDLSDKTNPEKSIETQPSTKEVK